MKKMASILTSGMIVTALLGATATGAQASTKHYYENWFQCNVGLGQWKDAHPKGTVLITCVQPLGTSGSYWMFVTK